MVITLPDQAAFTPAGNPAAEPIPVAPVVVCVILFKGVFTHKLGLADAGVTVLPMFTVMVPVANSAAPHPPVSGIL